MAHELGRRWYWRWFATPSERGHAGARLDGCFAKYHPDPTLTAIAECKARSKSRAFFDTVGTFPGQYILTADKITHGIHASVALGVPFLLLVYLIPDMAAYVFPITNHDGEVIVEYTIANTETRATVNGGSALRENAYIPFDYARRYDLRCDRAEEIARTLPY